MSKFPEADPPPVSSSDLTERIKQQLTRDKYVFVPSATMKKMLQSKNQSSSSSDANVDLNSMTLFWEQTAAQRDEHGNAVYPGKQSLCSYYDAQGRRVSGQETSLEYIDPTTVHKVSNQRVHKAWPPEADQNPTLVSLRDLVYNILQVATPQPETYETMQTAYRVTKTSTIHGDPGPEGIHQDSATLTVILLIHRQNVKGGVNRVWTLEQPNGKPSEDDIKSDRLLTEIVLENPLDALFVLDRQVKHEASAILPLDPDFPAIRDVLTFEVRSK